MTNYITFIMKHFSVPVMIYETLSAIELILIEDIFNWWGKQVEDPIAEYINPAVWPSETNSMKGVNFSHLVWTFLLLDELLDYLLCVTVSFFIQIYFESAIPFCTVDQSETCYFFILKIDRMVYFLFATDFWYYLRCAVLCSAIQQK